MNIYLISSTSIRLLEDEIKNIVGKNPYASIDLNAVELDDVLEEANYFSLFDEKKYMVVKNANIFCSSKRKKIEYDEDGNEIQVEETVSKKDTKLLKYLESPNPNTVLIFTVNGDVDTRKKITKMIENSYKFIKVPELKPADIINHLHLYLKADGYKCDDKTANYIVNSCQNNYDLVMNELDKIKLYYGKGTSVLYNDVVNIVSASIEDNNFKLLDAVLAKNIKESYKILDDLMLQKVPSMMLFGMFSGAIRNMLLVKQLNNRYNKKEIMKMLGIKYDFQVDQHLRRGYSFTEKKLEDLLVYLCDINYKIKCGKIKDRLALELFIMEVCK